MKKLSLFAGLMALAISLPAIAEESSAGGLEFSGNIDVVTGWQHDDNAAIGDISGQLRDFRGATAPNRDTFNFYLDQVELDIQKSFGDKIRIRADLDFGRFLSGSQRNTDSGNIGGNNFELEQGYVTAGVLAGEFSIGRFNAPVGYYLVDRADNPTISFSNIFNFVTPTNVTGAKMYWAFGDHLDLNVYVMNQLFDCIQLGGACLVGPSGSGDSAVPSWGMRAGYNFGEEGKKSTIGLSYMGGPEQAGNNAHLDHLLDLDFSIKPTENLLLAGEGIYYQRNNLAGVNAPNRKFAGGLLVVDYNFTDIWDLFFSYGYINDFHGVATGADQQIHNLLIGTGYDITDGAKMKLEYRVDIHAYDSTPDARAALVPPANGDTTSLSHGIAAEFAYNF